MFKKVLIANRGVIACRIARTLRKMGVISVGVYSDADVASLHVRQVDEVYSLGEGPVSQTYLNDEKILSIASKCGAEAIHPGYGFLSENASFAEKCLQRGVKWIGPNPQNILAFGLKDDARRIAAENDVPLLPGSELLQDLSSAKNFAQEIGYPVMLKSTAGGGGIGMTLCHNEKQLESSWDSVSRLVQSHFSGGGLILEKAVVNARHIEVQVFGLGNGQVEVLGERDCSTQRRNQKVLEEAPAYGLDQQTREALHNAAKRLAAGVNYISAGTVEFLMDASTGNFWFLEVNTRLQVEHGVTEEIFGIDLVEWMVLLASGKTSLLDLARKKRNPDPKGWAVQARIYAEDPLRNFAPCTGLLTEVRWPENIRIETHIETGFEIGSHFDPMLAKVIVHEKDREKAVKRLHEVLLTTGLGGVQTNLDWLGHLTGTGPFVEGAMTTRSLAKLPETDNAYKPKAMDISVPGIQSSIQDLPGRIGYWSVGVPPSGPMDRLSFALVNQAVGNHPGSAGLEFTMQGPVIRFHHDCIICLSGADFSPDIEGHPVPIGKPVKVLAGQKLQTSTVNGPGMRGYMAVQGGLKVPEFLGSGSTFELGRFGGHGGRCLKVGDVLYWHDTKMLATKSVSLPALGSYWELGCLYGPHGAPDFFTENDVNMIFSTSWKVHPNSSRTGVRLIGPKPEWARLDGGEAGLHPSNIHDNAYAVGSVDFTGDMPVLLGPDGPSLGGFVCPAVVLKEELWKLGQLKPGDTVQLVPVDPESVFNKKGSESIGTRVGSHLEKQSLENLTSPIIHERGEKPDHPSLKIRRSGDSHILIEYGPLELDVALRLTVEVLAKNLESKTIYGITDITRGIRSLQVQYDPNQITEKELVQQIAEADRSLPPLGMMEVPSREIHLPLSWDDESIHRVIDRYVKTVRSDAPWCPSNIEFIRRINGIGSVEEVKKNLFNAEFLVMGLGDVYLGAPVATPLDPRQRYITTKYNPARTWTVDNVVGIGGAYLCIYGMEGPGGYQLFGRTCQVWNSWRQFREFEPGKPWLLRHFDRIRFYPVSHEELESFRTEFLLGRKALTIHEGLFKWKEYQSFLKDESESIELFRRRQKQAFNEERERWRRAGLQTNDAPLTPESEIQQTTQVPTDCDPITASMAGTILSFNRNPGENVNKGDSLLLMECMKMEFPASALYPGVLHSWVVTQGQNVEPGAVLGWLQRPKEP